MASLAARSADSCSSWSTIRASILARSPWSAWAFIAAESPTYSSRLWCELAGNYDLLVPLMLAPVLVHPDDDVRSATQRLIANGLREVPVVDERGAIIGFLDEREVAQIYLKAESRMTDAANAGHP